MAASGFIVRGRGTFLVIDWVDMRKFLDGTYAELAYVYQNNGTHYLIVTEQSGSISYECLLPISDVEDSIDFENNFKNLAPRAPGTFSNLSTNIVSRLRKRYDLGVSTWYIGTAPVGTTDNSPGWTINRVQLTAGVIVTSEWTGDGEAIWDNRTTATYQ